MSFVNLTLTQFAALFGAIGAGVFLLYLLDRSQQRKVVASLRFWRNAIRPVESRRWKVRQPLSLLLQLLSIALLLLAVAQLRLGGSENQSRDHVLILDTSAWMGAAWQGGTLMDEARARAMQYIRSLPSTDRVIVVRAGGVETPATSFEEKRSVIEEAIEESSPGPGVVDLGQAVSFAGRVRRLHGRGLGEIVFVGSGKTAGTGEVPALPGLRFIPVGGAVENVGLARVGLRHAAGARNVWEVYVAVRNHGASARQADVSVQFASAPAAFEKLDLPPQSERAFTFPLRTRASGDLEVQVFAEDAFPDDNYVKLEIPARQSLRMVVYTRDPDLLRPLIQASPMVEAEFHRPGEQVETNAGRGGFRPVRAASVRRP